MRPDILFENFEMLADAPNGVPKLRELILQMAVQGKLVPQDPNDQPASVLLEKIQTEKKRLIKEKKIKKAQPLLQIDSDEFPYEVPNGWEWVKLGSIGITQTGTTPPKTDPKNSGNYIPFIKPADIAADAIRYNNEGLSKIGLEKGRLIEKNSILMVCIGGSIGKVNFIERDCSCNQQINALKPYSNISYKLLNHFLRSAYFQNEVTNRAPQTTLPILSKGKWELIPIPLPPEEEQKRIVAKIDQLIALCDELEDCKEKRKETRITLNDAALNTLLNAESKNEFSKHWQRISSNFDLLYDTPETVNKLRQAILQLAVQGKLVPQDPNDPPASVLLKTIQAEKERLIKEKKLKKTKHLAPIEAEEIPYELPAGWELSRLDNCSIKTTDGFHSTPKTMQTGYPYILATHVKPEKIDFDNCFYVSFNDHKEIFAKANPQKGDILLVNIGAGCGTPSIINVDFEFSFKNVAIVKRPKEILSKYLFYYLLSIREIVYNEITQGGAQPYLSLKMIKNLIFPLPPFNEQKRIVAKVDQLMVLCDELETKLTKSQNDCDELLSTIINSVENGKPENPSNKGSKSRNLFSLKTDKATGIPEPVKETFKSSSHKKPPPQRKKSQKPQARFKKPDVLRAYRKAIFRQYEVDELSLLRQVGQRLGIRRLSKPIQDELKSYIRTAIRRKILIRDGNGFIAGTPTIQYYDDDYLIKMLGSVTKKGWEYPRNYLVDKAAQYLGFGKPSNAFKDRMKSIFRMAIRQRIIYRNRSYVGKV